MTTAKYGIIPTEEKQKREESWKMVRTKREGHWVAAKKRIRMAVDDIEEAVKIN